MTFRWRHGRESWEKLEEGGRVNMIKIHCLYIGNLQRIKRRSHIKWLLKIYLLELVLKRNVCIVNLVVPKIFYNAFIRSDE